jgi:sulfite oxidase
LPWDGGAIGTAVWGGAPLREVLRIANVHPKAAHVDFVGLDEVNKDGRKFGFGGSIPLEKAESPEVLLAYEMNGEPLRPEHGFPLRVVVPGYVGARSVKWLGQIQVQSAPSDNYFYTRSYQLFPPQVTAGRVDWSIGIKLGEVPVNSAICRPWEGQRIPAGPFEVRGYALASAGRTVERVDVSADGGETWTLGALEEVREKGPWTWRFWKTTLNLPPGPAEIVVRAWDSAANTQPEDPRKIWNFKGYMNNSWHRVRIVVGG